MSFMWNLMLTISPALIKYAGRGDLSKVKRLLDEGADINRQNFDGQTALMMSIQMEHLDIAKELVLRGANINQQNGVGCTALLFAAYGDHFEIAKLLVKNGANPNIRNSTTYQTPLHVAINHENADFVQLLIEGGADISALGKGWLEKLKKQGSNSIVYLLENYQEIAQKKDILESPGKN